MRVYIAFRKYLHWFPRTYSQTYVQPPPLGPLLTGGRCSQVIYVIKVQNGTLVTIMERWSLAHGLLYLNKYKYFLNVTKC